MAGPIRVWNATLPSGPANFGTLTCIGASRLSPGKYFAVGASHVMAPLADADSTLAPSLSHTIACRLPAETADRELGKLFNWSPLYARSTGFANDVDAAIVEVTESLAKLIVAELPTFSTVAMPVQDESCSFAGATTPAGAATVKGEPGPLVMTCRNAQNEFEELQMTRMILGQGQAQAGDSGALVVNGQQQAVGVMLAAGFAENSCYLGQLSAVLDYFKLDPVTPAQLSGPAGPGTAAPTSAVGGSRDILARTLWGEARSDSISGMRAVAAVVLNRASRGPNYWWGGTIADVCLKPYQFSCWNANDPNLPELKSVTDADAQFRSCLTIADLAVAGQIPEVQLRATHYHTRFVHPSWAQGKVPCSETRGHLFYNNIE